MLNPHSEKSLETNLARFSFAGILVGHFFYVIGGNNGKGCTNAVSILNLLTLQWEDKKSYGNECLHGRLGHVGVFYDNRIFMHGGFNQDKIFAEMWILDLSAQSVSPKMGEFIVGSKYSGGVSYSTNMYNENFHFFDSGLKIQDADASKSRSSNLKNSYTNTPQDISSKDLKTENNGSK